MPRPRPTEVRRFQSLVTKRLGFAWDAGKEPLLAEVLEQRASAHRKSVDAYLLDLDVADREEVAVLAESLTIGETYFFRHAAQFQVFSEVILPELVAATEEPLRFLSAGCASGEEAYSLAMLCADYLGPKQRAFSVKGVDVNPAVLARARAGRYSAWSMRETSAARQRRWFTQEGNAFLVAEELRPVVSFSQANLVAGGEALGGPGRYHGIFCRNVLIYLTAEATAEVVSRLTDALVPGGFLVLGHAETLRGLSEAFDFREASQVFFYQRRTSDASPATPGAEYPDLVRPVAPSSASDSSSSVEPSQGRSWVENVQDAHDRILAMQVRAETRPTATTPRPLDLAPVREHLRREHYREGLALLASIEGDAAETAEVTVLRAVLHIQAGSTDLAEPLCQKMLNREDLRAEANYLLALCREAAGDEATARGHARMAVHLDPAFSMARLHLGLLARRAGDREEADRELEEAADLLRHEEPERLLLFGGGFGREALLALCRSPGSPRGAQKDRE